MAHDKIDVPMTHDKIDAPMTHDKIDAPMTHGKIGAPMTHDCLLSWFGTAIATKSVRVKLVLRA